MATTGPRQVCSTTLLCGTGVLVGQGNAPEAWILYSTDDASDTDPLWQDATAKVRGFSTSRGRENELSEVDAGTATLTLDNRARTFDPAHIANLLTNPSFETNLTGWSLSASPPTRSADFSKFGGWGLKAPADIYRYAWIAPSFTVGQVKTFSVWRKMVSVTGSGAGCSVENGTGVFAVVQLGATPLATGTADWERIIIRITCTSAGAPNIVLTGNYGGTGAGDAYFDGAQFVESSTVRDYFDGDQAGAMWTGTAHASTTQIAVRPLNRWKLLSQFSGETQPIFVGYAESYDQTWDGMDAAAVVTCADEFKVLALDALPVMNPPRDSYPDVVMFDEPSGYWRMNDNINDMGASAVVGPPLVFADAKRLSNVDSAIVGDRGGLDRSASFQFVSPGQGEGKVPIEPAGELDLTGQGEFTIALWFKVISALPASSDLLIQAGAVSPNKQFFVRVDSAGTITVASGGSNTTTGGSVSTTAWNHIVGTVTGGNLRLYINGAQVSSSAWAGSIPGPPDSNTDFIVGTSTATQSYRYDEIALFRHGLSAARVLAHYQAGAERGFAEQRSDLRIGAVLDASESPAPRRLGTGTRDVLPVFMHGQAPLEEIRNARNAEAVDSVFFTAKDGTLVFLQDGHRSSSPYSTVQATFDDDGTDLPYLDLDLDYSEAFLANDWNVTADGGTVQNAGDATSIARYFKRSHSLSGLLVVSDAVALTIATAHLAKYKDPLTRILSLTLTTDTPAVSEAAFRLDLGDRIRVFRTPPGGGARIDQTLFVQKISVEGANDGGPWSIQLGVSPL